MAFEGLDKRLQEAPEHVVRLILRTICHEDYHIKKKASDYLEQFNAMKKSDDVNTGESTGTKRKAVDADVSICVNCKTLFSETDNVDTACVYHTGKLYWDDRDSKYDVFEGDPTPQPEDIEDEEELESFAWSCCDERGDVKKGCVVGRHKGVDTKRRK